MMPAADTQSPMAIQLDHKISRSPAEIDNARRRFVSKISPSTKPRISGAIGTLILRSHHATIPTTTMRIRSKLADLPE